jgi:NADH:ubiquinone oxidoreductase subunit 5 (subunit L)/multisubunit Na+/H+ antiporter MnhA subunit
MRGKTITIIVIITAILAMTGTVLANGYGSWSPIVSTGYAVTSNYQGVDVQIGTNVTVTAGTTDLTITTIVFRWHDPTDNVVFEDEVAVSGPLTTPAVPLNVSQHIIDWASDNPGKQYLYAQSTHTPEIIGDWGVQAFFIGPDGKTQSGVEDVVQIRSTSFNVVPEVPVIGSAGAVVAMVLGLGFFMQRKKKKA